MYIHCDFWHSIFDGISTQLLTFNINLIFNITWYINSICIWLMHVVIPITRVVTIPIVHIVQLILICLVVGALPIVIETPPRPLNCKCCPLRSHCSILIYICILILMLGLTSHEKKIFPTPGGWMYIHVCWYIHVGYCTRGVSVTWEFTIFWSGLEFFNIQYMMLYAFESWVFLNIFSRKSIWSLLRTRISSSLFSNEKGTSSRHGDIESVIWRPTTYESSKARHKATCGSYESLRVA